MICDHIATHPTSNEVLRAAGLNRERCKREALPKMVRCAWHADPDAVTMVMREFARLVKP